MVSENVKTEIRREYKAYENGYKKLAKKYGFSRDKIRYILYKNGHHKMKKEDKAVKNVQNELRKKDKELKYLRAKAAYWEMYAQIQDEEIKNVKKTAIESIKRCEQQGHDINMLCSIAQIPRSSYYYSQNSAKQEKKDLELRDEILLLPEIIQKTYGTMRKTQYFKNVIGKNINHKRIERVAKLYNLQAVIRRNTHPKDYYKKAKERKLLMPKNILNRNFESEKPFLKLVTDISYFRIPNGWLYLCCIKDLYDSSVVR